MAEQGLVALKITLGVGDLIAQDLGKSEMLQQGYDVGKSLVKGEHIGIGGVDELAVHAVEQGVCSFVSDDVLRKTGEDRATRQLLAGIVIVSVEISEEESHFIGRIVGVGFAQGMGINAQLRDKDRIIIRTFVSVADGPPQGLRPRTCSKLLMVRRETAYTIC